ncbi:MAG: hypothetical protein NEHIOOID_00857 [Holosporales bacterium]
MESNSGSGRLQSFEEASVYSADAAVVDTSAVSDNEAHEDPLYTPQTIAIHYYRRETLRVATVVFLLALVDLWLTPLDAFLLLPASAAASYWLRDPVRFSHGGDIRRCFNRDCALMYFFICSGAALLISAIDCVVLTTNYIKSVSNENSKNVPTPVPQSSLWAPSNRVATPVSSSASAHSPTWFATALCINAASFVALLYGFYCIRKLRRLLLCTDSLRVPSLPSASVSAIPV